MDKPYFYYIKVKGHLDGTLVDWFDDLKIFNSEDGDALLCGHLEEQAALHGFLNRINSLGLALLSVNTGPQTDPTELEKPEDDQND